MAKKPETITLAAEVYYRCPECNEIIPDQERRCSDCNKFGARVLVWLTCPHCDEHITEEDLE